jgi:hypothetical protein
LTRISVRDCRSRADRDDVGEPLPDAVEHRPAGDGDADRLQLLENQGVVGLYPDRPRHVLAHLAGVDVKGRDDFDVADAVPAEINIHDTRRGSIGLDVAIIADALDQGRGTVADADDPNSYPANQAGSPTDSARSNA